MHSASVGCGKEPTEGGEKGMNPQHTHRTNKKSLGTAGAEPEDSAVGQNLERYKQRGSLSGRCPGQGNGDKMQRICMTLRCHL